MAVEVQMTEDVRKFDAKVIGPFNKRQMMCVMAGAVVALPAIIFPKDIMLKFVLTLFTAGPVAACGWIKYHGMYLEVMICRMIYLFFLTPQNRKYKIKNTYRESLNAVIKQEEKEKIKNLTSKERKEYYKNLKNNKVIYSKTPEYKVFR